MKIATGREKTRLSMQHRPAFVSLPRALWIPSTMEGIALASFNPISRLFYARFAKFTIVTLHTGEKSTANVSCTIEFNIEILDGYFRRYYFFKLSILRRWRAEFVAFLSLYAESYHHRFFQNSTVLELFILTRIYYVSYAILHHLLRSHRTPWH